MEQKRLSDGAHGVTAGREGGNVILPLKKRQVRPLKTAFYLFLIAFFCYCVWLTVHRLFPDGQVTAALSEFLLSQGF